MVQLFTVLTALAAAGLAVSAPAPLASKPLDAIPHGSPDGLYLGNLRADGSTEWTYHGPTNVTAEAPPPEVLAAAALDKRDGASCSGFGTPADDVNTAQGQLAGLFGNGYYWTSRTIAVTYKSGIAYGCNYGNGQTSHSSDYWSDIAKVNTKCGFSNGGTAGVGWYSHTSWKASYGRTAQGSGYC